MEKRTIKTADLRLARVKYFDLEHNGAELTELEAYAFIQKIGSEYINVFDATEDLPVLERSIYPNVMPNGEEFGTKLIHAYGTLTDGPCYVVEPYSIRNITEKDKIDTDSLKEYIFNSDKFFVDRMQLIEQEKGIRKLKLLRKYHEDMDKMTEFKEYIASHEKGKAYTK